MVSGTKAQLGTNARLNGQLTGWLRTRNQPEDL